LKVVENAKDPEIANIITHPTAFYQPSDNTGFFHLCRRGGLLQLSERGLHSLNTIYTIGHSNHTFYRFHSLLADFGIEALCDVRARPASRFVPWSNKKSLESRLFDAGIRYSYLGDRLGGITGKQPPKRPLRKEDFQGWAESTDFRAGLAELLKIAREYRTAVMCAEQDPSRCHRRLLITPELVRNGLQVVHILKDGSKADESKMEEENLFS